VPLVGSAGHIGAFGIALGARAEPPTPSQWQIVETFVAQTALALERALLVERAASARVAAETERTRSALLSAVSHDVRTPLASIAGAASALLAGDGSTRTRAPSCCARSARSRSASRA
jgi:two-component system sensor histidine kinase KdpD